MAVSWLDLKGEDCFTSLEPGTESIPLAMEPQKSLSRNLDPETVSPGLGARLVSSVRSTWLYYKLSSRCARFGAQDGVCLSLSEKAWIL